MKALHFFRALALAAGLVFLHEVRAANVLFGTIGAGNSSSQLVQIDPETGALVHNIGPVGFVVNGLAWDPASKKLFATTSVRDKKFHGLIVIDPLTGAGTPVNKGATNFGLRIDPEAPAGSLIHSLTINFRGQLVAWSDEVGGASDAYVSVDKRTGIATQFTETGINTAQDGLSFSDLNILWKIDGPVQQPDGSFTQTAYLLNPLDGKPLFQRTLSPATMAALGDFNPANNLYYGLNFNPLSSSPVAVDLVKVNLVTGKIMTVGQTVDDLQTLAFARMSY